MAVAKIECTCRKCGNTFTVRREFRNRTEATEWEAWATEHNAYDLCAECFRAEKRAEQNETAAAANANDGLPELTGSPKQIAWAESLRAKKMDDLKDNFEMAAARLQGDPEAEARLVADCERAMEIISRMTSASEWIDIRTEDIMRTIGRKLKEEAAK